MLAHSVDPVNMPLSTSDTKDVLLRAAVEIAETDGVGAIGLREAARRAGVTHGAPYRHFENQQALVAAVAERGFRELMTQAQAAQIEAGSDVLLRFHALGVAYLRFALAHPGQFRVGLSNIVGVQQCRILGLAPRQFGNGAGQTARRRDSLRVGEPAGVQCSREWRPVHENEARFFVRQRLQPGAQRRNRFRR